MNNILRMSKNIARYSKATLQQYAVTPVSLGRARARALLNRVPPTSNMPSQWHPQTKKLSHGILYRANNDLTCAKKCIYNDLVASKQFGKVGRTSPNMNILFASKPIYRHSGRSISVLTNYIILK